MIAVVRPFAAFPSSQTNDVALAWNSSIARLGILPVFPPEEDLHLGDLWAVIDDDFEDTPLLGKAVRLTHIDLRPLLQAARNKQPVFADTVRMEAGETFRYQPRTEVASAISADSIPLTLTAFPGLSIRHTRRATGTLARSFGGFGAVREDIEVEEIRIPVAETYGVNPAAAIGRLDAWCAETENRIYCTDQFARRVLAFAVSDQVLTTRDGHYVVRLQLRLVTRVFLTREVEHRRAQGGSGSMDAHEAASRAAIGGNTSATSAMVSVADGTETVLRQVFQRPVVFGFRAITVSLTPSSPSMKSQP
jgi:hypothetical protein